MEQGFFIPIGETIIHNTKAQAVLELTDQNPHGILGGATGSGKSELILTIITSIAMKYSPEDINFAVIDFKAGSTSDLVKGFPHCAGVASDLEDADSIIRAINLLKAENARRQKLLTNAVAKGIISKAEAAEYREAREKNKDIPPLPLLLIIVDEYGELKKQYDQFASELATIAKQGRSRFVYLLLADNESKTFSSISSNIAYRICLGFSDIADVHAVLNTPIKKEDKIFQQYAQTDSEGKIPRGRGILNSNGKMMAFQSPYVRADAAGFKSQLDAYIEYTKMKYEVNGNEAYCVLPKELSDKYYGDVGRFLNNFDYRTGKYSLSFDWHIPIGVYDDTIHNRRPFYYVNPPLENIVFIGNKGSGKTSALKTVLFNTINCISPKMCNIIILNFAENFNYDEYRSMPHVCDVLDLGIGVKKETKEKLDRALMVLHNIIKEQSGRFINERVEYLVFIDGYKFFLDHYPKIEMKVRDLITEGKAAGISFIIATNKFRYIPDVVRGVLQQRVLLRNSDDEFGFVFSGKCEKKASSLKAGRGIVEDEDSHYFDMQISFPACVAPEQYLVAIDDYKLSYYADNTYRAKSLPFMPNVIFLDQVRNAIKYDLCDICFGIETERLKLIKESLFDIDCILVEGTVQSGKTFLVNLIIEQLLTYKDECSLLIIDNDRQQHYSPNKPNIEYISSERTFDFLSTINEYVCDKDKETVVIIDDLHSLFLKIRQKNKSVYDLFIQWIKMQRSNNHHIHFVISYAAEANAYEFLSGFELNERILLGNKVMSSRFAAPVQLKTATVNTTIDKYYAWVCIHDSISCVKLINKIRG